MSTPRIGHEGEPGDCGGAAVFLASPMGRYVTGVTLSVDGGTWASSGWTRTTDMESWQPFEHPIPLEDPSG